MNFAFYFKRAHAAQNVQMPPITEKMRYPREANTPEK
jgi:hypothetical protein